MLLLKSWSTSLLCSSELVREYGVFHHTLDVTKNNTYEFLTNLFSEVAEVRSSHSAYNTLCQVLFVRIDYHTSTHMANKRQVFPDKFMHLGGDEVTGFLQYQKLLTCWKVKVGPKTLKLLNGCV